MVLLGTWAVAKKIRTVYLNRAIEFLWNQISISQTLALFLSFSLSSLKLCFSLLDLCLKRASDSCLHLLGLLGLYATYRGALLEFAEGTGCYFLWSHWFLFKVEALEELDW